MANRYPRFRNDRAVPDIHIGVKEFSCIGVSPPHDHPHVYINVGVMLAPRVYAACRPQTARANQHLVVAVMRRAEGWEVHRLSWPERPSCAILVAAQPERRILAHPEHPDPF